MSVIVINCRHLACSHFLEMQGWTPLAWKFRFKLFAWRDLGPNRSHTGKAQPSALCPAQLSSQAPSPADISLLQHFTVPLQHITKPASQTYLNEPKIRRPNWCTHGVALATR